MATTIQIAENLQIDVLVMQEVRRTSSELFTFDNTTLKGWQMVWSGYKQKKENGVGILLAPHVKLESHQEHLPARLVSATIRIKGMILSILNGYAPTDVTKSDATKSVFYSALRKAKVFDEDPKYNL